MLNYPLKFKPILKEKIWGGKKLKEVLQKRSDRNDLGESWEISGVKNDISEVANGSLQGQTLTQLLKTYKAEFLGSKNFENFSSEFPLLIKFIDANTEL
ncbi:type I phosphomannose isomerase catalytic subunit, partial [Longispora fulva]|uniref:type I phosphomannose isomerase catalytic subunit n=2 Tax=Bacteria TaxID=2 RepID=UPI00363E433F